MAKTRKRRRRLRREGLVREHLERVSRDLLVDHPDVVREFIGRNTGIYALYRKSRLYYVGLARALRHRLRAHGKNRHGKRWDQFSIYLTIKDQHLGEIESLVLRITKPPGAKQSGKLAQSKDMKRRVMKAIRDKQSKQIAMLFGRRTLEASDTSSPRLRGDPELIRFLPMGGKLRGIYKRKIYRARVRRDGRIRYNGRYFSSLSLAARAVIKRAVNGWWFWQIENTKGNWVRLTKIRRAGTPVYGR